MYCPIHFYIKNAPLSVSLSLTYMCTQAHTFCPSHCLSLSQFPSFSISLCLSVSQSLIFSMSPSLHLGGLHFLSGSRSVSQKRRKMICLFLFLSPLLTYSTLSLCYVILYYQFLSHFLSVRVSPLCLSYSLNFSPFRSHRVCPCLSLSVTVSPTLSPSVFLSLSVTFSLSIPDTPTLSLLCHISYYQFLRFGLTFCLSVSLLLSRYQFLSHFLGLSVSFTRSLSHAVL